MAEFLQECLSKVVHELTEIQMLPVCSWEPFEFVRPKHSKFGDFCTYSVLRV